MWKLLFSVMILLVLTAASQRQASGPVYIIHSDLGTLILKEEGKAELVLSEVDQTVAYVYSHPVRRIGAERLPEFIRVWASGDKLQYDKDPPDAHMLIYNTSFGDYEDFLVELYNLEYDEKTNILKFEISFKQEAQIFEEQLGEVTLFIDCFPFCV